MKASKTKPSVSKLIARFDDQLLDILLEDLRNYKLRNQFVSNNNKQVTVQQSLSAA